MCPGVPVPSYATVVIFYGKCSLLYGVMNSGLLRQPQLVIVHRLVKSLLLSLIIANYKIANLDRT